MGTRGEGQTQWGGEGTSQRGRGIGRVPRGGLKEKDCQQKEERPDTDPREGCVGAGLWSCCRKLGWVHEMRRWNDQPGSNCAKEFGLDFVGCDFVKHRQNLALER